MSPKIHVPPVAQVTDGVTEFDADDAADVPWLFVAVTVNVYAVPDVKPVTVIALLQVAEVNVPVLPPGLDGAV